MTMANKIRPYYGYCNTCSSYFAADEPQKMCDRCIAEGPECCGGDVTRSCYLCKRIFRCGYCHQTAPDGGTREEIRHFQRCIDEHEVANIAYWDRKDREQEQFLIDELHRITGLVVCIASSEKGGRWLTIGNFAPCRIHRKDFSPIFIKDTIKSVLAMVSPSPEAQEIHFFLPQELPRTAEFFKRLLAW